MVIKQCSHRDRQGPATTLLSQGLTSCVNFLTIHPLLSPLQHCPSLLTDTASEIEHGLVGFSRFLKMPSCLFVCSAVSELNGLSCRTPIQTQLTAASMPGLAGGVGRSDTALVARPENLTGYFVGMGVIAIRLFCRSIYPTFVVLIRPWLPPQKRRVARAP